MYREHMQCDPANIPDTLHLPADYPGEIQPIVPDGREEMALEPGLVTRLQDLSRRNGATLFMTLLAAWDVLLGRSCDQDEFIVGCPVAIPHDARADSDSEPKQNTLFLHADLRGDPGFDGFLARVLRVTSEGYKHRHVPHDAALRSAGAEKGTNRWRPTQVQFVLEDGVVVSPESGSPPVRSTVAGADWGDCDLLLQIKEEGGHLAGVLWYNTSLFEAETIRRLLARFEILLESAVANPGERIRRLPWLPTGEHQLVTITWNDTDRAYPRERSVGDLFAEQAHRSPDAVAVESGDKRITYRELNILSNQLGHYLRALGVTLETPVGICLDRSPDTVISLLGILKAGGAYVALDARDPRDRLAFMLEDTRSPLVITHRDHAGRLPAGGWRCICLDDHREEIAQCAMTDLETAATGDHLAYITYTSGSTGRPKGVEILHRGIARLVLGADYVRLSPADAVLHLSTLSFDASTFELWGPLLNGARCVLYPGQLPEVSELGRLIREHGISTLWLTSSLFNAVIDTQPIVLAPVEQLLIGGEALSVPHVRRALGELPGTTIINGYGPTESTTFTCCHPIPRNLAPHTRSIPIGRPIANTRVFVLDRERQPVPVGIPGELWIAGDGLARGYLGSPELTAHRFLPDPFDTRPGARLYRTGDICRWLPDGTIEYLGRQDGQVKIRGYRIELGEIEWALRKYAGVREAVGLVRQDDRGEKRIIAYVVPQTPVAGGGDSRTQLIGDLQSHLRATLPGFMIPATIEIMDALPLTSGGKVNRQALLAIGERKARTADLIPPQDDLEQGLCRIWQEVLGLDEVGTEDDFFDLGGHSLMATVLVSRIHEEMDVAFPLPGVFSHPTVAQQAKWIDAHRGQSKGHASRPRVEPRRVEPSGPLPLSPAQQRLWFLHRLEGPSPTYNITYARRLRGRLDVGALESAFREIRARHEILRTTFDSHDGQPVQVIAESIDVPVDVVDLRGVAQDVRDMDVERRIRAEADYPFNLSQGPLLRVSLMKLDEQSDSDHLLLINMHHIIADGWSIGILFRELASLYKAHKAGQESPLQPLQIQYADFAVWHRDFVRTEGVRRQLEYWKSCLADVAPILELPTDRARPPTQGFRGSRVEVRLGSELTRALNRLSRNSGSTLFMTLMAAWQVLLARYSGQDDFVVGCPIANRHHSAVTPLIGFFVNTLALRANLRGEPTFAEVLERVRQAALAGYENQDIPFEDVVKALGVLREANRAPLVQVLFVLQNAPLKDLELDELEVSSVVPEVTTAKIDLLFQLEEVAGTLSGELEYDTDLFERGTIKTMVSNFELLLEAIVRNPGQPIRTLVSVLEGIPVAVPTTPESRGASQPAVGHHLTAGHTQSADPRTPLEARLIGIWSDLLGRADVGIHDGFFELGGHSLLAVRLLARIEAEFRLQLPVSALFQGPTVSRMAAYLRQAGDTGHEDVLVEISTGHGGVPLFLAPDLGGHHLSWGVTLKHLDPALRVIGLQPPRENGVQLAIPDLSDMVALFVEAMCDAWPDGPYCVAGYSYGGSVAYEVARQLTEAGRSVAVLAVVDTGPPGDQPVSVVDGLLTVSCFLRNIPFFIWEDVLQEKPRELVGRVGRYARALGRQVARAGKTGSRRGAALDDIFDLTGRSDESIRLMDCHLRAWQAYSPQPYTGTLTLFRARTRPLLHSLRTDLGWRRLVRGEVKIVPLSGHHWSIMLEPRARHLAKQLGSVLAGHMSADRSPDSPMEQDS